ncbi:MAG: homoserine kinase [Myxococcota bacterium]|nr:homoserine kinase [Myxococcota bacterium]
MIRVVVPCSSGNLGSGFDALGVALDARAITISAQPYDGPLMIAELTGEGAAELPRDATNRIVVAASLAARSVGKTVEDLRARLSIDSSIPLARGMGSSASAAVAGAMLADALLGGAIGRAGALDVAAELEGHCDNVAPALNGGFQVSLKTGGRCFASAVPVNGELGAALYIPEQPLTTKEARSVLSAQVSMEDAVFNLARSAMTVAALARGDFALLRESLADRLHQPARTKLMPWLPKLIEAALAGGAYGAALSGAGTTVCALCAPDRADAVAAAMRERARSLGLPGVAITSGISPSGTTVTRS